MRVPVRESGSVVCVCPFPEGTLTCTVTLLRRKMTEIVTVSGDDTPLQIFLQSMESRTSVIPWRSALTRSIAMIFCSGVNHLAVSGLSVRVMKEMSARTHVMMPSMLRRDDGN